MRNEFQCLWDSTAGERFKQILNAQNRYDFPPMRNRRGANRPRKHQKWTAVARPESLPNRTRKAKLKGCPNEPRKFSFNSLEPARVAAA
jgi:hypothetical protein